MLEGKELEGKIGEVGSYSVDVDKTGLVKLEVSASKELEGIKLNSSNSAEISIFVLLEKVAQKTEAKWDDAAVAQVKALLNLVG